MYVIDRIVIAVNKQLVSEHMERLAGKRHQRIELDAECLRWTPLISSHCINEEERRAETEVCDNLLGIYV